MDRSLRESLIISSMALATYHRFVNTTPNPNATKKSNGELVGPPPPPPLLDGAEVAAGREEVGLLARLDTVVDDMIATGGRASNR